MQRHPVIAQIISSRWLLAQDDVSDRLVLAQELDVLLDAVELEEHRLQR